MLTAKELEKMIVQLQAQISGLQMNQVMLAILAMIGANGVSGWRAK